MLITSKAGAGDSERLGIVSVRRLIEAGILSAGTLPMVYFLSGAILEKTIDLNAVLLIKASVSATF